MTLIVARESIRVISFFVILKPSRYVFDIWDLNLTSCCGARKNLRWCKAHSIFSTTATFYYSLHHPQDALANVPFGLSLRATRRRVSFFTLIIAQHKKLALQATPLTKTIHWIVFVSLTQRAMLVGLIIKMSIKSAKAK